MKLHTLAFAAAATLLPMGNTEAAAKAAKSRPETARSARQAASPRDSTSRAAVYRGIVVGDRRTHRYHHPSDPRKPGAEDRRVYFQSPAAAHRAGYRAVQPWRLPLPSLPKRRTIDRPPASPLYPDPPKIAPTRPDPDW